MKTFYKIILMFNVHYSIFNVPCFSQTAPGIEWAKCYGGSDDDGAYSIDQTTDGGYVVTGRSNSTNGDITIHYGSTDYWVAKIDSAGTIQWQKSLGGTDTDIGNSIQQTTDGGFVAAGISFSNDSNVTGNHGGADYWVVKLDSAGSIQWQKSLGGTGWDGATSVLQADDGSYVVAGLSTSNDGDVTGNHGGYDYWVVKLDSSGNLLWQKCFGGTADDGAEFIKQTNDGGYMVVGESNSNDGDVTGNHGNFDYWVVKIDSAGTIQWQKSSGGTNLDYAYSFCQSADGSYMVFGNTFSNDSDVTGNHGGSDYWVIKLDSSGSFQWQKCFGGTGNERAQSIVQTTDGRYVLAGFSNSNNGDVTISYGNGDFWIVKIDSSGTIHWQKSLGGTNTDWAYSIQHTTDGAYVIAGNSYSIDNDVSGNHGNGDYWVVKLRPEEGTGIPNFQYSITNLQISPNPAKEFTVINYQFIKGDEIRIIDVLGETIFAKIFSSPTLNFKLQTLNYPAGVYLFNLANEKTRERVNGKIVVSN
ncbi:MAG: T9SS type A sorting domain-containing protein [Bacteroidia bacterium]